MVDYFKIVKQFLDKNPNEVLTLILTNPERRSIPGEWKPAFDAAGSGQSTSFLSQADRFTKGLTPMAYVPPNRSMKASEWPTLGQMIESGKRVVVFLDYGADGSDGGVVDFILPEFDMVSPTNTSTRLVRLTYSSTDMGNTIQPNRR